MSQPVPPSMTEPDRQETGWRGSREGWLEAAYAALIREGVDAVTCEYYTVPPNEASRRFHAAFGFREVGSQWLPGRRKQVSLQIATP